MQQQINVTVITSDAIVAVGLRHLLHSLFDIDALWIADLKSIKETDTASTDLFVTDAESFASAPGFFIPRRAKLAIITENGNEDEHIGFALNRHSDESGFIRQLTGIVETVRDKRADGNEISQRETDVLCLIAKGMTNKEIADRLFISVNTVLTHRKNISAKLGIRSVSGLSVYAMMNGYINDIPSGSK